MKTYHLSSANRSAEHYIMFSYGVSLRLSNYLFNSKPVARDFFKHLKGTTQRGLTDKHLDNLDYFKGLGAREENVLMNHIVIVSDEFVSLCARHQLKINFRQTLTE